MVAWGKSRASFTRLLNIWLNLLSYSRVRMRRYMLRSAKPSMTAATMSEEHLETMAAQFCRAPTGSAMPSQTKQTSSPLPSTMDRGMEMALRNRLPTTASLGRPRKMLCPDM